MAKNIKTFGGTNKAECITWLSQAQSAEKITVISPREMVCSAVSPAILQVLAKLLTTVTDQDIKNIILANYSDMSNTTEAMTKLQKMQMSQNEPLITFNSRYKAVHQVAYNISHEEQFHKIALTEYALKLSNITRDKLLRKMAKRDSFITTCI